METNNHQDNLSVDDDKTDGKAAKQAKRNFSLVLASASPRRKELLENAGVDFTVRLPQSPIDESAVFLEEKDPYEACKLLAQRKAGAVVKDMIEDGFVGSALVIGADTMVVRGDQVFGKPQDREDAWRILHELSGTTHSVITAVSLWMVLAPQSEDISIGHRTFLDESFVTFRSLDDAEIETYLQSGEYKDKAGAYGIQGTAADFVSFVEGDFDTVVGLPVTRLLREFPEIV